MLDEKQNIEENNSSSKIDENIEQSNSQATNQEEKKDDVKIDPNTILSDDADLEEMEKVLEASKEAAKNLEQQDNNAAETNTNSESSSNSSAESSSEKKEEEKKEEKKDDTSSSSTAAPDNTGEEKKEDKTLKTRIDEAFIKSRPEDEQDILRGLKGKLDFVEIPTSFVDRFVKNYIESQKYIKQIKTDQDNVLKQPDVSQVKINPDTKSRIDELTHQQMRSKYPTIGDTPEAKAQFERDLSIDNPRDFRQYLEDESSIRSSLENRTRQEQYMKEHQGEIAVKAAERANELLIQELEGYGIKNPREVLKNAGIDLTTFVDDKNEQLTDLIWDKTIPMESPIIKIGGNGNPKDYSDETAAYVIDPTKLYMRASYKFGRKIIADDRNRISQESYESGLKKSIDKHDSIPPSASASKNSSPAQINQNKTTGQLAVSDEDSIEEMERKQNELKNRIINKVIE